MFSFTAKEQIKRTACRQLIACSLAGHSEMFSFMIIIPQSRIKRDFFFCEAKNKKKGTQDTTDKIKAFLQKCMLKKLFPSWAHSSDALMFA